MNLLPNHKFVSFIYRLVQLSAPTREVSLYSGPKLMQKLTSDLTIENASGVLAHQRVDHCEKGSKKGCKSQRPRRTSVKWCVLNILRPLLPWTQSSCGCPHKSKTLSIPAGTGRSQDSTSHWGHKTLPLTEELLTADGFWEINLTLLKAAHLWIQGA